MTNIQTTQEIIICRDGEIDTAHYEALERARRVAAIKLAGKEAVHGLGSALAVVAHAAVLGYARVYDDFNGTDYAEQLAEL